MIEEPYRWVEAIANRAEYIETQLATGSPDCRARLSGRNPVCDAGPDAAEAFRDLRSDRDGRDRPSGRHRAAAHGGDRAGQHGRLHALGGRCVVAAAGALFAEPGPEDRFRAGLRRALSGAAALRRDRRKTGNGLVSAPRLRRRHRHQQRDVRANAAGFRRDQRHAAIDGINGDVSGGGTLRPARPSNERSSSDSMPGRSAILRSATPA